MKYIFPLSFVLYLSTVTAQTAGNPIRINQLGYYRQAPKIAILTGNTHAGFFFIVSESTKDTVFKGSLGPLQLSLNSATQTRVMDFTDLRFTGIYRIVVPGTAVSYPFNIGNNANRNAAVASLKGYYYMRVSMPLTTAFAGKWARAAGHPDTAVLIHPSAASAERPSGTVISTPGGWYDAGDYNKYTVNAGITMGTLLSAYEDFPSWFDMLKTDIPESRNSIPDILDEILYNLRWMLTMQDPFDGGVYNKCTNAAFDGMVMPGVTKLPRWVVQKGTAATLDFAAVMAQCSRITRKMPKQLPGLADSCLAAAKKAWGWALKNPAMVYDQNAINKLYEPKISTGAYGDRQFSDEWFWAAAELYAATKENEYAGVIKEKVTDSLVLPSWANTRMLGHYTLVRTEKQLPAEMAPIIAVVKKGLVQFADQYMLHITDNAFRTVMGQSREDFKWGSNSTAANQGIALVNAYFISKDKKYISAALTNLDYLLGRNATGYCFLTGTGTRSTLHPHHRPSVADGIEEPVPGLLAGGPNPGMQDKCHYDLTEPETAYSDTDCSYASNEIAINWNAPFVYLANAIEALQYELGYSKGGK